MLEMLDKADPNASSGGRWARHHALQRAIKVMKSRSLRWCRIVEPSYPRDQPAPTSKQLAILAFKHGIASHEFCRFEFTLPLAGKCTEPSPE
jgi:hypothetical protein